MARDRGRDAAEEALEAEIRLHIELRAEQLVARGWDPVVARAEAARRFGEAEGARRSLYRAARRRDRRLRLREWLDAGRQDARQAVRVLVREPAFALVVILTMALGIGANAAMFGVLDRLLLRGPDHVRDPASLMQVYARAEHPEFGDVRSGRFGYITYATLRDGAARVFEGVAAYSIDEAILGRGREAEPIQVGRATWDLFPLLGVRAGRGRFFSEEEDRPPQGADVVVVSHELWRRHFGGAADVIGRTIVLRGETWTVIGVAPRGFTGTQLGRVDAWVPMSRASRQTHAEWPTTWRAQWLSVVARLAPGVAVEAAEEAATRAWSAARERANAVRPVEPRLHLASLRAGPTGGEPLETSVTRWLVGVAAVVLLIACANVMNLLLARGTRRSRETAVRMALGVGRGRLARQLLAETLLLVALGGAAGLVLAAWGGALIRSVLLPQIAWSGSPVDARVIVCTMAIVVSAALATGLLPALRFARGADPAGALRSGDRDVGGRSRLRTALTVAQAALSVVLLVGAGLFVRSLANASSIGLGLDARAVLAVEMRWPPLPAAAAGVSLGSATVGTDALTAAQRARASFYDRALERIRGLPDVEHAALSVGTPFHTTFGVDLRVPGRDSIPDLSGGGPFIAAVSPGYFETVGTRLRSGRTFEAGEGAGTEAVAIINETMARTLWPDGDALGQCLIIGDAEQPPCSRIIGIVEDSRRFGLREDPAMQYWVPLGQETGFGGLVMLVRPRTGTTAPVARIRSLLQEMDGEGGYVDIEPLLDALDPQLRPWRLGTLLFGLFGALALLIAAIGTYSVVAYGVSQRTRELGVRMVLGADRTAVGGMVLRQGGIVALAGVCLGVLAVLVAGRFVEGMLFDVSPRDPWVLGGVALVLLIIALLASWIPALRATKVDPLIALRAD